MPKNARRFEILLYSALALIIIALPFPQLGMTPPPTPTVLITVAIWWVFVVSLIYLAARRAKNWARWLLFALFLLETMTLLWSGAFFQIHSITGWFHITVTCLEGAAYYFIFSGDSRDWFRKKPEPINTVLQ